MNAFEEIIAEQNRRHRQRLAEQAEEAIALRVEMPTLVRRATLAVLDEADNLEQAREIVEGSA